MQLVPQPRPQGLLLDDFQNDGSSLEDPDDPPFWKLSRRRPWGRGRLSRAPTEWSAIFAFGVWNQAMGLPVSVVVVAGIVMQHAEERALTTCRQTIPLWFDYVDDTSTIVHKDEIDAFQDHPNEQNADIQFSKEIRENEKLPFLNCLVSRDNNELRTTE